VVKKKKPVAKIKKKKPAVSKKSRPIAKRTSQKTASAGSKPKTSRSIKAGGGQGKGNVAKRNVKQAGILSMLGDSVGFKPNKALAAVTNLDAVSTTHVGGKNFKAGGIVGKLGSSKIEVPSSGRINTKGSTQVLRSGGAGAGGRVAALEKGKTGQKQVMAMVSAKLSKKVRIHGGMSREAVKRVIDQHLDEVNFCYENALIANPSIMGKIVFEWKIMMSGKVGEVKIKSSSIKSGSIHGCIKKAIKTWRFPKPSGTEVVVSYPFVFDIVGF
jgi:hypothetical protein